jgi:hypothetical protein
MLPDELVQPIAADADGLPFPHVEQAAVFNQLINPRPGVLQLGGGLFGCKPLALHGRGLLAVDGPRCQFRLPGSERRR